MDWFTKGRGVMLFWPVSSQRILPPFNLFYGVRHSEGLFTHHHMITLATESLTLLPLLAAVWIWASRWKPHNMIQNEKNK
jgi:inner membrane protein